jgi:hypothetical protein
MAANGQSGRKVFTAMSLPILAASVISQAQETNSERRHSQQKP